MDGVSDIVGLAGELGVGVLRVTYLAAPWLVFGLVAAGLIRALIPDRVVARWLGGEAGPDKKGGNKGGSGGAGDEGGGGGRAGGNGGGWGGVVRAAVVGTPLPLCSCGVVPAAIGLRRQGAGKPATVSFLVSTPENGADSIALTYALMGPVMAVARPIAGLISAIVAGGLTILLGRRGGPDAALPVAAPAERPNPAEVALACCAYEPGEDRSEPAEPAEPAGSDGSCCGVEEKAACCGDDRPVASCCSGPGAPDEDPIQRPGGVTARVGRGLRYALSTMIDDLAPWLILGLVIAGAVEAFVPAGVLAEWGSGPLAMLAMALVGVPMYVCATSFTPVGASLLTAGVSPGAVLVLLLAGPATNIGTVGIVKRELGGGALAAYLVGVIGSAVVLGLLLDFSVGLWGWEVALSAGSASHPAPGWLATGSLVALGVILVRPLRDAIFNAIGRLFAG